MSTLLGNEKDLLETVRFQEEQLSRYKRRLQDIIVAHKKLTAEKDRLDEVLKTIIFVKSLDETNNTTNENDSENVNDLKIKMTKLAKSVTILSEEKVQMETQFLQERKKLMRENSQLKEKIKTAIYMEKKNMQDVEVQNTKTQLNLETVPKKFEFTSMIRDLQKVNDEGNKKENKEIIEKLKDQLRELQEKYNTVKNNENVLLVQLNEIKKKLGNENTSSEKIEKLKTKLKLMSEQHDNAVHQEQNRTLKAEERTRKLAIEHESRVSKLEQKLTQLSDLASKYDKYRQDDQQVITKLKNRVMQLEIENSNVKCEDDRVSENEETLIQQLQHIKQQLIHNYTTSYELDNLREILLEGLENVSKSDIVDYKELYIQLKQQIEEPQQKSTQDLSNDNIPIFKTKILNLKSKIMELELFNSRLQQAVEFERENALELLEKERKQWKLKMNTIDSEYRNKLILMEHELEKQREKLNRILEEKEKQLQHMQQPFVQFFDESSADINETNIKIFGQQKSTLIYYLEIVARKEAEINRLRKINNELQLKVHETEKEYYHYVQLFMKLQKLTRGSETAPHGTELNTEYLKNVFLNYLITSDGKMRSHMLNAIFAILKFTDLEINCIMKQK
ncbi:hypothetical protein PGB90_002871 [Kerria lacca]